jgi:hypothetical protein
MVRKIEHNWRRAHVRLSVHGSWQETAGSTSPAVDGASACLCKLCGLFPAYAYTSQDVAESEHADCDMFLIGKSMGSRMGLHIAPGLAGRLRGCICLGYPLVRRQP